MRVVPGDPKKSEPKNRLVSEGKILEITPTIRDEIGVPWALPPVTYRIPNWLLAWPDNCPMNNAITLLPHSDIQVPAGRPGMDTRLSFTIVLRENNPEMIPQPVTLDAESVERLLNGLAEYRRLLEEKGSG